jgi:hypothetical protein
MKDFGRWMAEQSAEPVQPAPAEIELPEGVWEEDGKYMARCCKCHEDCVLDFDLSEILKWGEAYYDHYCGGSPRCCP